MSYCVWVVPSSSEVDGLTEATKTTRMASFPDYLMVQLNKFTLAADWTPKKLDVAVDMPSELDLTPFRGSGLQPGEVELASGEPSQKQGPCHTSHQPLHM